MENDAGPGPDAGMTLDEASGEARMEHEVPVQAMQDQAQAQRHEPEPFHSAEPVATVDGVTPFPTLAQALLSFQKEALRITKDQKAHVVTKTGPGYDYWYLTLEKLLEEVLPLLTERGLRWTARPSTLADGVTPGLYYKMEHVLSGEYEDDKMPLMVRQGTPQDQGSAISFARRYSILAYLNLAPDRDEDGTVSEPQGGTSKGVKRITKAQATTLAKRASDLGLMDRLQLCATHHHGQDVGPCGTIEQATEALRKIDERAARQVRDWLDRAEAKILDSGGGDGQA